MLPCLSPALPTPSTGTGRLFTTIHNAHKRRTAETGTAGSQFVASGVMRFTTAKQSANGEAVVNQDKKGHGAVDTLQEQAGMNQIFDEGAFDQRRHVFRRNTTVMEELPADIDWGAIHRVAGMKLIEDDVLRSCVALSAPLQPNTISWDDLEFDTRLPGTSFPEWPVNTGPQLIRFNLAPQSLWAPDILRLGALRRRHSCKKIAMQELAIGQLIHNLVRHVGLGQHAKQSDLAFASVSPQIQRLAWLTPAQVEKLKRALVAQIEEAQSIPDNDFSEMVVRSRARDDLLVIPAYSQDADGDFHLICNQMNLAIRRLFEQITSQDNHRTALAVSKICHNLLVSTAPPDLQTFNLLLSGFKQCKRPDLVNDVILAFEHAKIRPNEISCQQILDHYTNEARPRQFTKFVAKMRGANRGLMLAQPKVRITNAGRKRLIRLSNNKIIQKVHPTPMVFGALIRGVIKFAGFDRALDVYYELKADGWGLDIPALTDLLSNCVHRTDWEGGAYLWEEIDSIKTRAKPRDMAKAYYHMLGLCVVTKNTIAFNQLLGEVTKRGFDRKSIMNAAMRMVRQRPPPDENVAPPWAADNLLIAVSEYMEDSRESGTGYDVFLEPQLHRADSEPAGSSTQQDHQQREDVPDLQRQAHQSGSLDPDAIWASWVDHELNKKL